MAARPLWGRLALRPDRMTTLEQIPVIGVRAVTWRTTALNALGAACDKARSGVHPGANRPFRGMHGRTHIRTPGHRVPEKHLPVPDVRCAPEPVAAAT